MMIREADSYIRFPFPKTRVCSFETKNEPSENRGGPDLGLIG